MEEPEYKALGQALRRVEFFSGLSVAELDRIFSYIKLYAVNPGEIIFKEGGPADALFIVYQGNLNVQKKKFPWGSKEVAILSAGNIFGEMALLDRKKRSATVRAADFSKLFVLLTSDFDRVVSNNPQFLEQMKSVADHRKFVNRTGP